MNSRIIKPISNLLILIALEGLITLALILFIPADSKNSLLLGFSFQRWILIGVVVGGVTFFFVSGWGVRKQAKWTKAILNLWRDERASNYLLGITCLLTLIIANILLIPDYHWKENIYLFIRLRPILIWFTLIGAQITLGLCLSRYRKSGLLFRVFWQNNQQLLWTCLAILGLLLALWGWMAWSGMGIIPDSVFWNDPGVPLLVIQVLISLVLGCFFYVYEANLTKNAKVIYLKTDILICILVGSFAALFWIFTPQSPSFFAPGPYPPNNEFYPFSDANIYDTSAQSALIGRGYTSPFTCADKPLYITLLTWLHWFGGGKIQPGYLITSIGLCCFTCSFISHWKTVRSSLIGTRCGFFGYF